MDYQDWKEIVAVVGYHPEGPFRHPEWSIEGLVERYGADGARARFDKHLETLIQGPRDVDYDEYINSPEWKDKVNRIKSERGNKCQVCSATDHLDGHHNTYDHFANEHDNDIVILCRSCHDTFHATGRLRR